MTPGQKAITYGIRLVDVVKITGVPKNTLYGWLKTKPKQFEAMCLGAVEMRKRNEHIA